MALQKAMFGDIVQPSVNVGTRRWYTIPLSIAIHAAVIVAVVIIPLMAYDVLPTPYSAMDSFRTVALPPLPSPPPPRAVSKPVVAAVNPDLAPIVAPPTIAPEPPDLGFDRALDTAAPLGVLEGGDPLPIPPPVATASPATLPPVRVGGEIKRPVKTKDASPVYPQIAVISRVQGVVIIEATIGVDGSCPGGEGASLDPASRLGGARCGETVGVHSDAAQWRAGAGHHDRHRAVHAGTMNAEKPRRL